jgi:beta-carotene 15,15'-dioxygenase
LFDRPFPDLLTVAHSSERARPELPATEVRRARTSIVVALIAVTATLAGWHPTGGIAVAIAGVAAVVGMPHGAYDAIIGLRSTRRTSFFARYVALIFATIGVWFVQPHLSLVAFLMASWFHFATGDTRHVDGPRIISVAHGMAGAGFVIGFPLAARSQQAASMLEPLTFGRSGLTPNGVVLIGLLIVIPSVLAALVSIGWHVVVGRASVAIDLIAIITVVLLVDPLVSFAIYFAFWHSPRHLATLRVRREDHALLAGASLVPIAAGVGLWLTFEPSVALATQVVFIGLAALTTPHLVVTEMSRRASQRALRDVGQASRLSLPTAANM